MASFDGVRHDDFEVNGVIVHLGSSSEIPSHKFGRGSQCPRLSSATNIPLVVSTKTSPFHHEAIIPVVPNNDHEDENDAYREDHQNMAFCASATLVTTQAEIDSSTDESDIEAFLEYARDVVAYNNTPYDPVSFQDFEQLLGECIVRCFGNDDDNDKDSLASDKDSVFSGYDHETGVLSYRYQQMLKKTLISDLAANRIKGVIAQKKNDEQALTTINGSFVPPRASKDRVATTKPEVDSSDDSMTMEATAAISLQSLKKSRVSRGGRKSTSSSESNTEENDSDSSENEKRPRRKRPKQRRRMRKTRKAKRELPPRSRSSKDGNMGTPCNRSTVESPSASRINISAILSCSPAEKEKVLRYLKEFAPQLYKTVVERMDEEDKAGSSQLERGYHNDSGFLCTPERPPYRSRTENMVASKFTGVTLHNNRFPPSLKMDTPKWKPSIDASSVIWPSDIKTGIRFNASSELFQKSNQLNDVTISFTEHMERVLREMLEKQMLMKSNSCYLPDMTDDGRELIHENITNRGMAVIHKFRAKRKAILQAKFLQHSQEGQTSSVMMSSSPGPPSSENCGLIREDKRSPQQLDSYMAQAQSSTSSKSSSTSSLEEQRQKFRRLKESRRRNIPPNVQVQESRTSLLQTEHELVTETGAPELNSLSSDGLSSMSKASPFRHIKFPLQKKKDNNYEALTPESSHLSVVQSVTEVESDSCSPLLKYNSSLSSSTSSSGNSQKNNSFFAGGLNSVDINKIIIDPQSPEYISPIRDTHTWDLSEHSRPVDNAFTNNVFLDTNAFEMCDFSVVPNSVPTIFDCNTTSTGQERNGNPNNTSSWSEMSFQSDPMRFPLSSSRKHPSKLAKSIGSNKGVSMQSLSKRIEKVMVLESIDFCSGYNDSFDEIVSRGTPSHKNNKVSPGDVMDVFFQSQLQCKEKNDFLSFVDEEDESAILFTDKEEDSFVDASYRSPLQDAVFITNTRFEI